MAPETTNLATKAKSCRAATSKRKEVVCMPETKRTVRKAFTFRQVARKLGVGSAHLQESIRLGLVKGIVSTQSKFSDEDVDLVANFYAVSVRKELGGWARMLDHLSSEDRRQFEQETASHPFPATY